MRLIDADALKINIYHNRKVVLNDELVQCIDNTPTAYDPDKVVEQMNDRSTLSRPVGWSKSYEIITLDDAIEIVKGGGVDD